MDRSMMADPERACAVCNALIDPVTGQCKACRVRSRDLVAKSGATGFGRIPELLDFYDVSSIIAKGGSSIALKARNIQLNRIVVVKWW